MLWALPICLTLDVSLRCNGRPVRAGGFNRSTQHLEQLAINNDDGLPNRSPKCFQRVPPQPAIPITGFALPPSYHHEISHLSANNRSLPSKEQVLRRPVETTGQKQTLRPLNQSPCEPVHEGLYNIGMNEASFIALSAWLTQAGLAGTSETDIVSGFCDRCVAAGLPLARSQVLSTRSIRSTKVACSAGDRVRTKPRCSLAAPTPTRWPRPARIQRFANRQALAKQPVPTDAANRRRAFAPTPECRDQGRVLVLAGLARRRG